MLGFLHSGNVSNDNNRALEMWSKCDHILLCYLDWLELFMQLF